jgi:hypothetical protein
MQEHKIGDLVMRPYMEQGILGWVSDINRSDAYQYQIEWIEPNDNCAISYYGPQDMREAKGRLDEYLRTQDR